MRDICDRGWVFFLTVRSGLTITTTNKQTNEEKKSTTATIIIIIIIIITIIIKAATTNRRNLEFSGSKCRFQYNSEQLIVTPKPVVLTTVEFASLQLADVFRHHAKTAYFLLES